MYSVIRSPNPEFGDSEYARGVVDDIPVSSSRASPNGCTTKSMYGTNVC
jgi:hypothetical protein